MDRTKRAANIRKKLLAVAVSGFISLSAFTYFVPVRVGADFTSEIAELEAKQSELAGERAELEQKLRSFEESARESAEYMELYNEKMKKQEAEIRNIKEQIGLLNIRIESISGMVKDKKAEIDTDIVEFKKRIRTIYMEGNDSMASILVGSVDFYDILMRSELMERVSRHDKEMIDSLREKILTLNSEKEELEQSMTALEDKRTQAESILEDLKDTYNNHADMKAYYEAAAEAQREKTDEMREQEAEFEDELQAFIRAQQEENDKLREEQEARRRAEREEQERIERERREEEERAEREKEEEQKRIRAERLQRQADQQEAQRLKEQESRQRLVDEAEAAMEEERRLEEERKAAEAAGTNYGDSYSDQFQDPSSYREPISEETPSFEEKEFDDSSFEDLEEFRREEEERNEPQTRYEEEDYDTYSYDSSSAGSVSMVWPCPNVYNMTDGYGHRTVDEEGGAGEFHKGIDITKPGCAGEDIVAAASGTVITASNTGNGYGIHVIIDHGGKLSTLYGHMSDCVVNVGDYVEQGQLIGYIGCTGQAYGNHLHFEVRVNGQHTDPLNYVSM